MNYEMVKSGIVVLTGRENSDVTVGWILQSVAGALVGERKREI
jgi:hypothetical protein